MILAAGLGTRLRPLTDELPKPLVPLGDRPAIAHIAARLAAAGIARAVVNTHHLAEAFTRERLAALPIEAVVLHEPVVLGTAGGVANAAGALGSGDVLVWNGDILADLDAAALLAAHAAGGAIATLAVAPRPAGEGTVGVDAAGGVVRLRGERFDGAAAKRSSRREVALDRLRDSQPAPRRSTPGRSARDACSEPSEVGNEVEGADYLGVLVLSAEARSLLPPRGCLVGDVLMPALRGGRRVATHRVETSWDDVGTIAAYLDANARWLAARSLPSFVGEGARVDEGALLVRTIVGAGARVMGGRLEACVVWPGAVARGPLRDAVITTAGRVAERGAR